MLRLYVFEEGADAEWTHTLSGYLASELRELDVDDVASLPSGEAPSGSRTGGAAAVVGGLLVSLGEAANSLASVVYAVRAWLQRGDSNLTVRLEIDGDFLEVSRPTSEDQERLVELFISKHQPHKAE